MSHRTLRKLPCLLALAALGLAGGGCSHPAAEAPSPFPSAEARRAMHQDMRAPNASTQPAATAPSKP